jgi:hypothetical protein
VRCAALPPHRPQQHLWLTRPWRLHTPCTVMSIHLLIMCRTACRRLMALENRHTCRYFRIKPTLMHSEHPLLKGMASAAWIWEGVHRMLFCRYLKQVWSARPDADAPSLTHLTTKVPRLLGAVKVAAPLPSVVVVTAVNRGVVRKDEVTRRNLGPRAPAAPAPGPVRPAVFALLTSALGAGTAAPARATAFENAEEAPV